MIFFILVSVLFSINFKYEVGDWFTLSNPKSINSITSTNNEIIFCSENGVFKYNMLTSSFNFDEEYLREFDNQKSIIVFYDEYRDYLWYLTDEGLNYKPRISSFWSKINFYELNTASYRSIINIGSDFNYIYLDVGSTYLILNPFTGRLVENQDIAININNINWSNQSNYQFTNIDLTRFNSFENLDVISNNLIRSDGVSLNITAIFKDKYHDFWVGTDRGEVFYCDSKMNTISKIKSIPIMTDINITYYDDFGNWWFSSNDNVLVNEKISIGNELVFFSRWIEEDNRWLNYTNRNFKHIFSSDITSFYRLDNWLYIGTNKGLVVYDLNSKDSLLIDQKKGLLSNIVNEINYFSNNIYIATNSGINVLSTFGNVLLSVDELNFFNNVNIFSFFLDSESILIASELGLYEYIFKKNKVIQITEKKYQNVFADEDNDLILSRRKKIFKSSNDDYESLISLDRIKNVCYVDNFLWVNSVNNATLFNLNNNKSTIYNQSDGIIGNIINHIGCDESWVWFSTNKGVTMYNWSKYHNNEK